MGYIPYGGADFGEIAAVARAVGDGDDSAFYAAWIEAADRLAAEAATLASHGKPTSAASCFSGRAASMTASYHPLYGKPVDPRLFAAFRRQTDALDKALALRDLPVAPLRIPFERTSFCPRISSRRSVVKPRCAR